MAILKRIGKIVLAHNHPSGNLDPSEGDLILTQKLVKAGQILDIELLDHIIITLKGEYCSFKDKNLIK